VFDLFATILAWFYAITHNYALAIALLTLCVMLALTPLTLKGTKSMLQLQKLQPQIKRLQSEHKGDRQKLNEEMMALYKENRINPLSGCLPLLLQAPIFFILYRVLRGLTRECPSPPGVTINGTTCVKPAFNPDYIKQSSEMFKALFNQTKMMSFGLNLAESAAKELSTSFIHGLPYLILVILVGALSYYQQRQVSSRMKDQVNPQQQMIMKVIPGFFALIALTLPSGLIVYFLTSSLYRIAQQAYITRKFYRQEAAVGPDDGAAKKLKPGASSSAAKDKSAAPKPAPQRPTPSSRSQASKSSNTPPPKGSPARPPKAKAPENGDADAGSGSQNAPPGRPAPTRPQPRPRSSTRPTPKKK
jgi:YidC/Oxa1 family membrane protein insertase